MSCVHMMDNEYSLITGDSEIHTLYITITCLLIVESIFIGCGKFDFNTLRRGLGITSASCVCFWNLHSKAMQLCNLYANEC